MASRRRALAAARARSEAARRGWEARRRRERAEARQAAREHARRVEAARKAAETRERRRRALEREERRRARERKRLQPPRVEIQHRPKPAPTLKRGRVAMPRELEKRSTKGLARSLGVTPATVEQWRRSGAPAGRAEQLAALVERREMQLARRVFDHLQAYREGERPEGKPGHYRYDLFKRAKRLLYKEFGSRKARALLERVAYDAGWSAEDAARFARLS